MTNLIQQYCKRCVVSAATVVHQTTACRARSLPDKNIVVRHRSHPFQNPNDLYANREVENGRYYRLEAFADDAVRVSTIFSVVSKALNKVLHARQQ